MTKRSASAGPFLSILVVVLIAAGVAAAGSAGSVTARGLGIHWWIAITSLVVNWVAFVPSFLKRTEHYYDLVGTVTYLTTTILAVVLARPNDGRAWLLALLVAIWAVRLGSFLFRRVKVVGKDGRFDRVKHNGPRFAVYWSVQGLWVIFTAAAAHAAIITDQPEPLGLWAALGLALWVAGFTIEVVADRQKSAFRADPANQGHFIRTGLWAWSRHPNYVGEIMLWLGVAIIAWPALSGWQYLTLLSPVFVIVLLTRISGIPALEARADKRWGGQDDYEQYKAATPVLIPRLPA